MRQLIFGRFKKSPDSVTAIPLLLLLLTLLVSLSTSVTLAQTAGQQVYPGDVWAKVSSPEDAGYSSERLGEAEEYSKSIATAAVMVIVDGLVLCEWGETNRDYNIHSIRKSFLSALYGIHEEEGNIDISRTMRQLGIDDNEPSLTDTEMEATVHQLLKARSGVYHPALYETAAMAAARPERSSHAPGTFWYYNNWDFNVLCTIFRNLTKTDIYREFERRIAIPTGMEDYDIDLCNYVSGSNSVHPAYPFRMTARDMARFGLLFLRNGVWEDEQIVPRQWVADTIEPYSDAGNSGGYGYLWWIAANGKHLPNVTLEDGSYSARGAGGHYILVIPSHEMVIVHRVNTDRRNRVSSGEFGTLVNMILNAKN